ncbi:hypothetical protein BU14_0461s0008 [Porphyra umbilicalis]|uniref:DUF547 domain-containing protein n=1 Tax=Porphyra umbilicalis TaxID=2786 RepID=A0A1X6NUI4_PORUM|nr:hypothetical protein BU14_0461s0008 [Porphyra umbilicalis]|eukprot:OSX72166.1 hypothetical protein BU14_0461s0008 [Porphyra umbilicalis]
MVALTAFSTPIAFSLGARLGSRQLTSPVSTAVGLGGRRAVLRARLFWSAPALLLPAAVTMGLPRLFTTIYRALVGSRVLNEPVVGPTPPRPGADAEDVEDAAGAAATAAAAAGALRGDILALHTRFLSDDGTSVDYEGLRASDAFASYVERTRTLGALSPALLTERQRLVLFINIYNMLTIHALCVTGAPSTSLGRLVWTTRMSYRVGDHVYGLSDIENGVLRGNAPFYVFAPPFGPNDPRREVALPEAQPLIHMALNCGATSCPPVRYFEEDNVEDALEAAAASFLNDDANCAVDVGGRTVWLSAIFSWYATDFGDGTDVGVLGWVRDRLPEASKKRAALDELLTSAGGPVAIKIIKYDWSLNT